MSIAMNTFDLFIEHSSQNSLKSYLSSLLRGTHHYILLYKDYSYLVLIKTLMHSVLAMDSSQYSSVSSRSIGLQQLETCIRIAADCLKASNCTSIDFFITKEIENIFYPIGIKYTYELIEAFTII